MHVQKLRHAILTASWTKRRLQMWMLKVEVEEVLELEDKLEAGFFRGG